MYKDFIYYDINKVQSIIAQMNKGLVESIVEGKESKAGTEVNAKTGFISELLGLQFGGKGSYERGKSLENNKSLHDYAFTLAVESLGKRIKDVSSLDKINGDKVFVKVRGSMKIYDYKDLSNILKKMDNLNELFGLDNEGDAESLSSFSQFIREIYGDLTIIEITNNKGISFIGVVENEYLRETMQHLIFKYGTNTKKDWEMICQVTKIPTNSSQNISSAIADFGKSIDTSNLNNEKSLGDFMNKIIKEFSVVYDAFASVSYPNIAVEPIGVYRNLE